MRREQDTLIQSWQFMQGWCQSVKGWCHVLPLNVSLIEALQHIYQVAFAAHTHSPAAGMEGRDLYHPGWKHVLDTGSRSATQCQGMKLAAYPARRLVDVLSSSGSESCCSERFGLITSSTAASSMLPRLPVRLQLSETAVTAGD